MVHQHLYTGHCHIGRVLFRYSNLVGPDLTVLFRWQKREKTGQIGSDQEKELAHYMCTMYVYENNARVLTA